MLDSLFSQLTLLDVQQDVARNIVSPRPAPSLFDDLSDNPADWSLAADVEASVPPPLSRSPSSIIDQPFDQADWLSAIDWPFSHWRQSRFSDGSFGVWYGSDTVETTVYESAYHWHRGLLTDAGFEQLPVVAERQVFWVACSAALLDFRKASLDHPLLLHPADYTLCQSVGARLHREGHPGLCLTSVRRPEGDNFTILNPSVLSNARLHCHLTYRLEGGTIQVEREGVVTTYLPALA